MNNRNRKYTNGVITVIWQPAECVHSTICFTSLRPVFNPVRRPWVDMSGAETEAIIDVVERCPSRALTFFWNDEAKQKESNSPKLFDPADLPNYFQTATETPPEKAPETASSDPQETRKHQSGATVSYRPGAPLIIQGNFKLVDGKGNPVGNPNQKMASICRCGLSGNQPFCDGAHFKAGFNK